ncbi:MAG: putative lipid II flippase FtsW [Pseudomonadota bacterium]
MIATERPAYGLDAALCAALIALLGWGLIMVASASVAVAEKLSGAPMHFFFKQVTYMVFGLGLAALIFAVPMKTWEQSGHGLLLLAFFLLLVVFVPGVGISVNGSRRWIDLLAFRVQVSEPTRLALLMYLAGYIVRQQAQIQNNFFGLLRPLVPLAAASVLLLVQPDFGATAILLAVALLMLFLGGARLLHLGALTAVAAVAGTVLVMTAAYRLRRMMSFTDPWADINNSGWQLAQALIAVGRGEWTGVGLGNSLQKLLYLPETHTDFIFAILAEEFGLFGIAALLALFAVVVVRGFSVARLAEKRNQRFPAYLCYGLTAWLGLQALINMAVNMGLLPTKGLTLPLISYGGSSLLTVLAICALILRVDHENRLDKARAPAGGIKA